MTKRANKMPKITEFDHARNLTSLAHHMDMSDVTVEFSWGWGGLYRVKERSGQFAFFGSVNDVAANIIAKARVRNASRIYRTGE